MKDKRVKGYPYIEMRQKEELAFRTFEYDLPFNYPNVTVWRKDYQGGEFHGMELLPHNTSSPKARPARVDPGRWTLIQTAFVVPPETTLAEYRIEIADMSPDETLWIADAFAGIVPDEWCEHDDVPTGTPNLIGNPTFSGGPAPPPGWNIDTRHDSQPLIELAPTDADGHTGLRIQHACTSLYTEIPVQAGNKVTYSLWVKSTHRFPKSVCVYPRWKNKHSMFLSDNAGDCIIIEEEEPIVRVAVIGSACTPPGYVMLEAEPCEEFYRGGDYIKGTAPVRFRQSDLWGMHIRGDQWLSPVPVDTAYGVIPPERLKCNPGLRDYSIKTHYRENPLAGMSCAIFEIPKSRKVIVMGGSETTGWLSDDYSDDDHYSFRTIRTTVASGSQNKRAQD